ncbi:hypothetical protein [Xanthomonas oryzae]|uniref:hypothetical protein n=1 Tax=Xanthomonas oryzae TaxID=347 RepID=UPI0006AC20EA|nr:hypothetical protein [Xanthomonas oryzae]QBG93741.1 hypothetical protein EYR26_22505 [Xanthomonas oryzae]UNE62700.1 hypothetical protein MML47_21720 [Xanthomonas oryzae]
MQAEPGIEPGPNKIWLIGNEHGMKGGVIASTQAAIDQGLNRLSTGTLTVADITNTRRRA